MNLIIENYHLLVKKYQELEKQISPDEIHDKRVILRRIFPILSAYGIKPSKVKNGEKAFKLFGKLRDIQVQIQKLNNAEFAAPINEYLYFLKDNELELQQKVLKFTKKKEVKFPKPGKNQLVDGSKLRIKAEYRLIKLVEQIRLQIFDDSDIHALRVEFKKFRYLIETLALVENIDAKKIAKLKIYQDMMGEIHDLEILISGIKKYFQKRTDEEVDIEWLEEIQNKLIQTFDDETELIVEVCRDVLVIDKQNISE